MHFLTTTELAQIKKHYPDGGSFACRPFFPGWSDARIQGTAFYHGVRCNKSRLELIAVRKAHQKEMLRRIAAHITDSVPPELLREFKSYVEGIKA